MRYVQYSFYVGVLLLGVALLAQEESATTTGGPVASVERIDVPERASEPLLAFDFAALPTADFSFFSNALAGWQFSTATEPEAISRRTEAQASLRPQPDEATPPLPPDSPAANTQEDARAGKSGWPRTTAATTLAGPVAKPPDKGRWIDVNLKQQTATAYVGSQPIRTVLASTGTKYYPTVVGTFRVWAKVKSQTMKGGSIKDGSYYNLPNVTDVLYFYKGYALHAAYWHTNFGQRMSHGCVNLTLEDARWLFEWASVGTIVRTHN